MVDGFVGFYFDELNKVWVLELEIGQQIQEFKEECKEFVDSKQVCFLKNFKVKLIFCFIFWMVNFGYFGLKFVFVQILIDNEFIFYLEIGEF